MKVIMINGSPHEKGCTYTALHELELVLNSEGVETEIVQIGKKAVAGCVACCYCKKGHDHCVFNDDVNNILDRLSTVDGIVLGSPVYYCGPSGQMKSFLDRLFFASNGRFDGKVGAAVVSCRRGGAATTFDQLNKYFSISNMPIATSQYWNQVHGFVDPGDVQKDLEGVQTMRTLGRNMAWMMKSIQAGRQMGVNAPEREKQVLTNFIH